MVNRKVSESFVLQSWQELLDQAGLTQRELAALVEYGEGTISDLVKKDVGGPKLKKLVRRVLEDRLRDSQSEVVRTSTSESSGVELREQHGEYKTAAEWKEEAIKLRAEVERLRAALHTITAPLVPPPISSRKKLSDAQAIVKQSGALYDQKHPQQK